MKVFSVLGFKGGITKTSLAVNLAAGFARSGLRTVLLDMDAQANSTTIMRAKAAPGIYNLILADHEFKDVVQIVSPKFCGMDCPLFLVPSNPSQSLVDKNDATPSLICERIEELDGWADVVVIDTSPGATETHAGVYYASDFVILPTTLQMFSLQSLAMTISFLANAAEKGRGKGYEPGAVLGIAPNCFSTNARVEQSNFGYVRGKYDDHYNVFPAMRKLTVWDQAAQLRQSIFAYEPADDYNTRRQAKAAVHEFNAIMQAALIEVGVAQNG
jgi:cellulose biosynthesis protein BcsQ